MAFSTSIPLCFANRRVMAIRSATSSFKLVSREACDSLAILALWVSFLRETIDLFHQSYQYFLGVHLGKLK